MKRWQWWGAAVVAVAMVAVGLHSIAFAQPEVAANTRNTNRPNGGGPGMGPMGGPMGGMMPGGPNRVVMQFSEGKLYVLQSGELVKYDGATLKEEGTAQIAEKTTAAPAGRNANGQQPPAGVGPAAFLISDGNILLVAGNTFYRIDSKTMNIAKQTALPTPDATAGQGGMRPPMGPPQLELGGKTLFVVTGNRLYSINIAEAKVTGQVELKLPAPPQGGPHGMGQYGPGGMGPDGQGGPPPGN